MGKREKLNFNYTSDDIDTENVVRSLLFGSL